MFSRQSRICVHTHNQLTYLYKYICSVSLLLFPLKNRLLSVIFTNEKNPHHLLRWTGKASECAHLIRKTVICFGNKQCKFHFVCFEEILRNKTGTSYQQWKQLGETNSKPLHHFSRFFTISSLFICNPINLALILGKWLR